MIVTDSIARVGWIAVGIGAALCILGLVLAPERLALAWLCAAMFWIGVPFGALALYLTHDLTGGTWGESLRPVLRGALVMLPAPSLAVLPILLTLPHVYPWAQAGLPHFYLSPPLFVARSLIYLTLWNGLALLALRQVSTRAAAARGAIGLILLAVTGSLAAIDWSMSLEWPWSSSVYGMLATAEWVLTALAAAILATCWAGSSGTQADPAMKDGSLGKLLLAVLLVSAYLAFVQFLIVWEENLAHEIPWYVRRLQTGWAIVAILVVALEFVLPFLLLLSHDLKRRAASLAGVAALVLAGRLIETWWLVLPARPPSVIGWMDCGTILALGGAMLALLSARRNDLVMARLPHV